MDDSLLHDHQDQRPVNHIHEFLPPHTGRPQAFNGIRPTTRPHVLCESSGVCLRLHKTWPNKRLIVTQFDRGLLDLRDLLEPGVDVSTPFGIVPFTHKCLARRVDLVQFGDRGQVNTSGTSLIGGHCARHYTQCSGSVDLRHSSSLSGTTQLITKRPLNCGNIRRHNKLRHVHAISTELLVNYTIVDTLATS